MAGQSFREKIYNLITKRAFYHTLFWLVVGATIFYVGNAGVRLQHAALLAGINLIFLAVLLYLHPLFLVPNL